MFPQSQRHSQTTQFHWRWWVGCRATNRPKRCPVISLKVVIAASSLGCGVKWRPDVRAFGRCALIETDYGLCESAMDPAVILALHIHFIDVHGPDNQLIKLNAEEISSLREVR